MGAGLNNLKASWFVLDFFVTINAKLAPNRSMLMGQMSETAGKGRFGEKERVDRTKALLNVFIVCVGDDRANP